MERMYDQQDGYSPYLFYVVFGTDGLQLNASPPHQLEVIRYTRNEDTATFSLLEDGAIGRILQNMDEVLYANVKQSSVCLMVRGNIQDASRLQYLQDTVRYLDTVDTSAIAILDLLSLRWYSMKEWHTLAEQNFQIHDHVQILLSEEQTGVWLHTRGMMKYGRPDISIQEIPYGQVEQMKALIDQIIYYEGLGAMVVRPSRFHVGAFVYEIHPVFYNDVENDDFNNTFIEMNYTQICKVK